MLILLFLSFGLISIVSSAREKSHEEELKEKALFLLRDGLQESERTEALEILMRINLKLYSKEFEGKDVVISDYLLLSALSVFFISLILSIKPKLHIGIGKGDLYIKRWRVWIKFFSYALPLFIISSILTPWIYDKLKGIL
jgi:hypothetical protein